MPRETPSSAYLELDVKSLKPSACESAGVALHGLRARLAECAGFNPIKFEAFVAMATAPPTVGHTVPFRKLCQKAAQFAEAIESRLDWLARARASPGADPGPEGGRRRAAKTIFAKCGPRVVRAYIRNSRLLSELEGGLVRLLNRKQTAEVLAGQNLSNTTWYGEYITGTLNVAWRRLGRLGAAATAQDLLPIAARYPRFRPYATEEERGAFLDQFVWRLERSEAEIDGAVACFDAPGGEIRPHPTRPGQFYTVRGPRDVFLTQLYRLRHIARYPDDEVFPPSLDAPFDDEGYLGETTLAILEADLRARR